MSARLAAALCCALAACSSAPGPATHDPVKPPAPAALPSGVTTCDVLGATSPAGTCRLYDTQAKAFATAPDPLARRAYLYDRWLDLWHKPEGQVVERRTRRAIKPEEAEAVWSDEALLETYDDEGDSANWTGHAGIAAAFRYIATGAPADYDRLAAAVKSQLLQFEATGMEGYLSRHHYAGVPPGTQILNQKATRWRYPGDANAFDIPAAQLAQFPAYYTAGVDSGGQHVATQPSWEGHTSIDAWSGPLHFFPIAIPLVKDAALKARMVRHYTCFLKRLRLFHITSLSKNTRLQADLAGYLAQGLVNKDPGDPDLSKTDDIWGFYLPQYNVNSAANYPRACPDQPSWEPAEAEVIDASASTATSKMLLLFLRQGDGDAKDAMDFAWYPSVRGGDGVMLHAYATAAYQMTGDATWLRWRDDLLVGKANAAEVMRTVGSFAIPKACSNYYRLQNTYTAHFVRLLTEEPGPSLDFANYIWSQKYAAREIAPLRDALFEIEYASTTGKKGARLDTALADLASLGGTAALPDSPRRDYDVDSEANPPPGITVAPAPQADVDLCKAGVTVLGIHIDGSAADPWERFSTPALPVMARPPKNFMWEKDPYWAKRVAGASAGSAQYEGLDLTMPYWIGRAFGVIPDPHLVLAWGP
jgi:hypothetical protein